jgi:hypothetical protein
MPDINSSATEYTHMDDEIKKLGPLAALVGTWEGEKGEDDAPSEDRGLKNTKFRERMIFEFMGDVNNHEQVLYALRYKMTAWKIGDEEPFHEELGYWLWDQKEKQVMRCFMVPRGVTVIAGGTVEENATSFELAADVGSETYGICSNKFLDDEFKTVRYELKVTLHDDNSFSYEEDTQLKIKGQDAIFHHTDKNRVQRVS